jgi:two-component system chemotaxis response regulator CheY
MDKPVEKMKVMVVDDSAIYRKLVEHAIGHDEYSLLFAQSGREALEMFGRHAPSIVITDWMMPDISGLELCEKIRGDKDQNRYTYIILLTGKTEKGSVVKGLAAGADDYLTKPFDPEELVARLGVGRRMIELHREIEAKNKLLEEMAHTDPLTDLPNRRAIEEWAGRQLQGAARHGFTFWVVYADLDGFKNVNDTYGHDAGDAVLKRFAELLRRSTRASDICGRMGGDEFIVVITHVDDHQIRLIVERLRQQFASAQQPFERGDVALTASFGIAGFRGYKAPPFMELVATADQALYEAKRNGRNQYKLAPTSNVPIPTPINAA